MVYTNQRLPGHSRKTPVRSPSSVRQKKCGASCSKHSRPKPGGVGQNYVTENHQSRAIGAGSKRSIQDVSSNNKHWNNRAHIVVAMSRYLTRRLAQTTASLRLSSGRRCYSAKASFDWKDPLNSKSLLTEEEVAISETAERYCQEKLAPRVLGTLRVRFLDLVIVSRFVTNPARRELPRGLPE